MNSDDRDMQSQKAMYDPKNRLDGRDPAIKMREHNDRVCDAAARRFHRYNIMIEERRSQIQIVTPERHVISTPQMLKGFMERLKQAHGNFSLFHFSLQLGRLRIELSRASGSGTQNEG